MNLWPQPRSKSNSKLTTLLGITLICSIWLCCLAYGPNIKMNRHSLREIMVEASIQLESGWYAGSALYGWNLLFSYVHLDNIIEIQTSCVTKQRLRAGAASLYVLDSPGMSHCRMCGCSCFRLHSCCLLCLCCWLLTRRREIGNGSWDGLCDNSTT